MLEDAGRSNVPFTTGILIGIGETLAERADSIFAIRQVAREYGGIQEVIVQNFRAKPDTTMRGVPDAELDDLAATIAVARLVLGPAARIQAPPNLIGEQYRLILAAGIDDWGGVSPLTPDHVNPERPWPQIDDLAQRTAAAGFELRERLTVYPRLPARAVAGPQARRARRRAGRPGDRAGPRRARCRAGGPGRSPTAAGARRRAATDLHVTIDTDRPDRRPPGRLRRGVRRLGRDRRADRARPPGRPSARRRGERSPGSGCAPRCWPRCAAPRATRPG